MSSSGDRAKFHVKAKTIDDEHHEIIMLVNGFDELLRRGGTAEQIVDLFAVVLWNIRSHFETEERLMLKHTYTGYQSHKAEHDRLLDELSGIMSDCENGAYADGHSSLAKRITDWFNAHLAVMDAPMIEFEHQNRTTNKAAG